MLFNEANDSCANAHCLFYQCILKEISYDPVQLFAKQLHFLKPFQIHFFLDKN